MRVALFEINLGFVQPVHGLPVAATTHTARAFRPPLPYIRPSHSMTSGRHLLPVLETSTKDAPKSVKPPCAHGAPAPLFARISTHMRSPRDTCQEKTFPSEIARPPVHVYSSVLPLTFIQVVPLIFPSTPAETKAVAAEPPHHLLVRVMSSVRMQANPT